MKGDRVQSSNILCCTTTSYNTVSAASNQISIRRLLCVIESTIAVVGQPLQHLLCYTFVIIIKKIASRVAYL